MHFILPFTLCLALTTLPGEIAADPRTDVLIGYSERSLSVDSESTGNNIIVLKSAYGVTRIILMRKNAPQTAKAVQKLAAQDAECLRCRFYRNEARPPLGDLGPPYGLLQGSLPDLSIQPPREGNMVARRGHACMIPGTKEFFIAASDHSEWGTAHTVWGEVEDMAAVDEMLGQAYHEITHPDYGTVMRMLDAEIPFTIKLPADQNLPHEKEQLHFSRS